MKKSLRKRTLSLFLCMVMVLSMVPGAFAAGDETPPGDGIEITETVGGDTAENPDETLSDEPADSESTDVPVDDEFVDQEPVEEPVAPEDEINLMANGNIVYVANAASNGSDKTGNGSQGAPYLTIDYAIATGASEIKLMSDIAITQELSLTTNVSIDGQGNSISYTGTVPLGNSTGVIHVFESGNVSLSNVTLENATNSIDGRVVYVGDGNITMHDVTLTGGKVGNANNNQGGAGLYVANMGSAQLTDCEITGNSTNGGGGGLYVENGGAANLSGTGMIVTRNNALLGGGFYIEEGGSVTFDAGTQVTQQTSPSESMVGYIEAGVNACVTGAVTLASGDKGAVYLATKDGNRATLDIAGPTVSADINVACDPNEAYRLVSKPVNYTIQPTRSGDESGWNEVNDVYDIRYMVYDGQPGLYLFYKTHDISFYDAETVSEINANNIDIAAGVTGKTVNFVEKPYVVPGTDLSSGRLMVPAVVPNDGNDYVIELVAGLTEKQVGGKDDDTRLAYRIPTKDVIEVSVGGVETDLWEYIPDFETNTAILTIKAGALKTDGTINVKMTADRYRDITFRMEGPLYSMAETSVTGLKQSIIKISADSGKTGTEAVYHLTRDDKPVAGINVQLYKEDGASAGSQATDVTGTVKFSGLDETASYYTVLVYDDIHRVIERDEITMKLSTQPGQTLSKTASVDPVDMGVVTYDFSAGDAGISGIKSNGVVEFTIEQLKETITFKPNEGDATTAPATLSRTSKEMPDNATTYGELATASLTGYTFLGWFTAAEGGQEVTSATRYNSSSPKVLYAHWEANDDTAYQVEHWVEKVDGTNVRYIDNTTATKTVGGVTYYLYDTASYTDGVSDAVKDISGLDLKTMSDSSITWWTRDGFTAVPDTNCKVLADGSSVFGMYYNRNEYKIKFVINGAGTATTDATLDDMSVYFGKVIGTMPVPVLPGYEFAGWHKTGSTALVTGTDVFNQAEDLTVETGWNAAKDTCYAVRVMTQKIFQHSDGQYFVKDEYADYKTVYVDADGSLLIGESDTEVTFQVTDLPGLNIEGFKFIGYSDEMRVGSGHTTKSDSEIKVYVKPTDMSTDKDGKYNEAFDGGVVYVYFDRKTVDISAEDGQGGKHDDEIIYGGDFTGHLPPDPGKDGYDFDDWRDKDGNIVDEKTPADDYVIDGEIVDLIPAWTARNYNLTYVPGTGAMYVAQPGTKPEDIKKSNTVAGGYIDPNQVTYDAAMGVMPSAKLPGYDFTNWTVIGPDGTQKVVNSETIVTIQNVIISNSDKNPPYGYEDTRALTANYTPHVYTLVFDAGKSTVTGTEGTVSPERLNVTFGQPIPVLPTPVLPGYRFVGWQLDVKDLSTAVKSGSTWTTVRTNGAEIPVYAVWMPETYRYTFDLNDSVGSTRASLVDTTIEWTEETFDSVYGKIFTVEAMRNGYDFKGWSMTRDGAPLTGDDLVAKPNDAILYAIWEAKAYDVKLVMKGGKIADLTDNNLVTYDPTASYDEATDTWTIKVLFDSVYGELPVPVKADCTYNGYLADAPGWPAKEGYGNTIHEQILTSLPQYIDFADKDGITLTAVLEPWFVFDPDGGKFEDGSTDSKKELQSDIEKLPVVDKDGFEFDGWHVDGKPDKIVDLNDIKNMTEPETLKPTWSVKITFNGNGGKVNGNDTAVISTSKLDKMPSANRSGYDFTGWFDAATGGNAITRETLIANNTPVTVYAQWKVKTPAPNPTPGGGGGGGGGSVKTYDVKFETNGGSEVKTQTVNSGAKATKPENPTKQFYKFLGWYAEAEFKTEFDFDTKIKADTTVYAKWEYTGPSTYLTTDHIAYIAGFPDGQIHPNAKITRAEVAMIFYRLLNDSTRSQYKNNMTIYSDVNTDAWYSVAVATLSKMGVIKGRGNDIFDPNANITRAEFAVIASRFDTLESGDFNKFSDVPSNHWAYQAIGSASAKGWVVGYDNGKFGPEDDISRAETVTLVNRVLGRDKLTYESMYKHVPVVDARIWPDNTDKNLWYYLAMQEATNGHDFEMDKNLESWTELTFDSVGNE